MGPLVLSVAIFLIGVLGVLVRRNLIVILLSIELMLSAVNIALVHFSKIRGTPDGQAIVLIVFVIAACEAAVGLAIIVQLFRKKGTIDIGEWNELKN
jgi:NADH-quinone oxidoreductase subunit K